jgi:hypothetical protein
MPLELRLDSLRWSYDLTDLLPDAGVPCYGTRWIVRSPLELDTARLWCRGAAAPVSLIRVHTLCWVWVQYFGQKRKR